MDGTKQIIRNKQRSSTRTGLFAFDRKEMHLRCLNRALGVGVPFEQARFVLMFQRPWLVHDISAGQSNFRLEFWRYDRTQSSAVSFKKHSLWILTLSIRVYLINQFIYSNVVNSMMTRKYCHQTHLCLLFVFALFIRVLDCSQLERVINENLNGKMFWSECSCYNVIMGL